MNLTLHRNVVALSNSRSLDGTASCDGGSQGGRGSLPKCSRIWVPFFYWEHRRNAWMQVKRLCVPHVGQSSALTVSLEVNGHDCRTCGHICSSFYSLRSSLLHGAFLLTCLWAPESVLNKTVWCHANYYQKHWEKPTPKIYTNCNVWADAKKKDGVSPEWGKGQPCLMTAGAVAGSLHASLKADTSIRAHEYSAAK